jgi:hypothetical protein
MKIKPKHLARCAGALLLLSGVSFAANDPGSLPISKGVYHLRPGIYVARGADCGEPPNAAIRLYDGKGLNTAHTHACNVVIRSAHGASYAVEQTCVDSGEGPGARFTERQEVTVQGDARFTQRVAGVATTYQYCAVGRLGADLRDVASGLEK